MQLVDVLNAILTLDVGYFIWLVQANVHWIFMFAAIMVFFQARKKRQVLMILVMVLMLYSVVEFANLIGRHITGIMQIPIVVATITIAAFTNYGVIKKHEGALGLGAFWAVYLIFSFMG